MYNIDGFNERTTYIKNANGKRRLSTNAMLGKNVIHDSSFAQMKVNENKPDVETVNKDYQEYIEDPRGNKDNFVLRNYNLNHINPQNKPNPVKDALNRNRFKKF